MLGEAKYESAPATLNRPAASTFLVMDVTSLALVGLDEYTGVICSERTGAGRGAKHEC
jgi:hypothetical protein